MARGGATNKCPMAWVRLVDFIRGEKQTFITLRTAVEGHAVPTPPGSEYRDVSLQGRDPPPPVSPPLPISSCQGPVLGNLVRDRHVVFAFSTRYNLIKRTTQKKQLDFPDIVFAAHKMPRFESTGHVAKSASSGALFENTVRILNSTCPFSQAILISNAVL